MKIIFLLFLILITYTHTIEMQFITIGANSTTSLDSSKYDSYFYIPITGLKPDYSQLYLLILDEGYDIDNIYYAYFETFPVEDISYYGFSPIEDLYNRDVKAIPTGRAYYYTMKIWNKDNYLFIRYTGRNIGGSIKARAHFIPFIYNVTVNSNYETNLTRIESTDHYFYMNITYTGYSLLYLTLKVTNLVLYQPIHYCKTYNNPENYLPTILQCRFIPLNYYQTKRTDRERIYYYNVAIYDVNPPFGFFLFRYSALSYGTVFLRSYYLDPYVPPISTVGIVFIVIGSVVFVGIIIGVIIYFYKKRKANQIANLLTQPDVNESKSNYPLVEQNNNNESIN